MWPLKYHMIEFRIIFKARLLTEVVWCNGKNFLLSIEGKISKFEKQNKASHLPAGAPWCKTLLTSTKTLDDIRKDHAIPSNNQMLPLACEQTIIVLPCCIRSHSFYSWQASVMAFQKTDDLVDRHKKEINNTKDYRARGRAINRRIFLGIWSVSQKTFWIHSLKRSSHREKHKFWKTKKSESASPLKLKQWEKPILVNVSESERQNCNTM